MHWYDGLYARHADGGLTTVETPINWRRVYANRALPRPDGEKKSSVGTSPCVLATKVSASNIIELVIRKYSNTNSAPLRMMQAKLGEGADGDCTEVRSAG